MSSMEETVINAVVMMLPFFSIVFKQTETAQPEIVAARPRYRQSTEVPLFRDANVGRVGVLLGLQLTGW